MGRPIIGTGEMAWPGGLVAVFIAFAGVNLLRALGVAFGR